MIKKRILVTGANGFIGHHWCKKLIDAGHKVDAVDIKKNRNLIKSKNFQYYQDTILRGLNQRY